MSRVERRRRKGFTLMEVLLVMAILIILASLVTVGYQAIQRGAKQDAAKTQINALEQSCMFYMNDVGTLPNQLADLRIQPQGAEDWRGPYLDEDVPSDPWKNEYMYEQAVDQYDQPRPIITSVGPDGQRGTQDDVTNAPNAANNN